MFPTLRRMAGLMALFLGTVGWAGSEAHAQPEVFEPASPTVHTSGFNAAEELPKPKEKFMRVRLKDVEVLRRGEPVVFNLFPDVRIPVTKVEVSSYDEGTGFLWSGRIEGTLGWVSLGIRETEDGPRIRGFIHAEEGGYHITAKGGGIHLVKLLDRSKDSYHKNTEQQEEEDSTKAPPPER